MYLIIQTSVEHEATAFGNKRNRLLPADEAILFPSILEKKHKKILQLRILIQQQ